MTKKDMDRILKRIAKEYNTTPEHVYREMESTIEQVMATAGPSARALWDQIPRKGEKNTVEEVIEYVVGRLGQM